MEVTSPQRLLTETFLDKHYPVVGQSLQNVFTRNEESGTTHFWNDGVVVGTNKIHVFASNGHHCILSWENVTDYDCPAGQLSGESVKQAFNQSASLHNRYLGSPWDGLPSREKEVILATAKVCALLSQHSASEQASDLTRDQGSH